MSHSKEKISDTSTNADLFAERIICDFNLSSIIDDQNFLSEIHRELVDKFQNCLPCLDQKFLDDVLSADKKQTVSRLWEVIVLDSLLKNPRVTIDEHKNHGPDWKIKLNGREYYVEATCAHLPNNNISEIHRFLKELQTFGKTSSDHRLIQEVKARISNRVNGKIEEHSKFMAGKQAGYILCLSYGAISGIPSCDLYNAVSTVLTIGPLTLEIDPINGTMQNAHLSSQSSFIKLPSGSPISTDILGNEQYSWISAILFSRVDPSLLLSAVEKPLQLVWGGKIKNDFVLVHNPNAMYPLTEDIFGCRTIIEKKQGQLIVHGENIFPSFGSQQNAGAS
jgi:hypothetical protein